MPYSSWPRCAHAPWNAASRWAQSLFLLSYPDSQETGSLITGLIFTPVTLFLHYLPRLSRPTYTADSIFTVIVQDC